MHSAIGEKLISACLQILGGEIVQRLHLPFERHIRKILEGDDLVIESVSILAEIQVLRVLVELRNNSIAISVVCEIQIPRDKVGNFIVGVDVVEELGKARILAGHALNDH